MSYSKYLIYQKQVSYDNGETWQDIEGETTYSGNPIETYASESGCVLDGGYKYLIVDSSGNTSYKGCDGNDLFTEDDIISGGGMIGGWDNPTHLYIGDCVRTVELEQNALIGYYSGVTFSRSVRNINGIVGYRNWKSAGYQIDQTLTIPNTVETIATGVTYWNDHGFQGADNIVFEANSSLRTIGDYAFDDCDKITSITIPDSVTSIGKYAFAGCDSLSSITIPDNVTTIGNNIFYHSTGLTHVTIGSGITHIPFEAFRYCSGLTSVTIPDTVETVGLYIFNDCRNLPTNQVWYVADNMIYRIIPNTTTGASVSYVPTIPSGTKILLESALDMYNDNLDWSGFKIPSSVTWVQGTGRFYTDMTDGVYYIDTICKGTSGGNQTSVSVREGTRFLAGIGTNVTQCVLPTTLEVMMTYCFAGTKIDILNIPDNVWYLGERLGGLYGNSYIRSVVFSNNSHLRTIGDRAFAGLTQLQSITIPSGVTVIPYSCFNECSSLPNIVIPDSVTTIGDYAFSGCTSLTSVTLGNGITTIGDSAFNGCSSLRSVVIPNSVTTVGSNAFSGCTSLTSTTFGNNVKTIGSAAFYGCSNLQNINLPVSVNTIGNSAFQNCTRFTTVTIPNNVTSIGSTAFRDTNLTSITLLAVNPPELGTSAFMNVPLAHIYVPYGSVEMYKNANRWSSYSSIIEPILP